MSISSCQLLSAKLTSCCSSGVEHFLGKEEVVSSILINSSQSSFDVELVKRVLKVEKVVSLPVGRQVQFSSTALI